MTIPRPFRPLLSGLVATCLAGLPFGALAGEAERSIAGALSYLPRIALPADALMIVELHGSDGALLAEVRARSEGRQVPLDFTLAGPAGDGQRLQGAILVNGVPVWLSAEVALPDGAEDLDIGTVLMSRHVAMGFATRMRCGTQEVTVGVRGDGVLLGVDGATHVLAPDPGAASGARFAAPGDDGTFFWSRGDRALVSIAGEMLPECLPVLDTGLLPLRLRGNEPGWTLSLAGDGAVYEGDYGTTRIEAALPADIGPGADGTMTLELSGRMTLHLDEALCHDTMTGMPYPLAARLTVDGETRRGCGGDPAMLLTGAQWQILEIGGSGLAEGTGATIEFAGGGRVSGNSGCNSYAGGFALDGEGLRLGPLLATRMACPPAQSETEARVFEALGQIDRFDILGGRLVLIGADVARIVARRP